MLILLKADQLGLFEATTIVKPHVRKDGVLVKPHARKVKRRQEPVKAKVVPKGDDAPVSLDLFEHTASVLSGKDGSSLPIVEHQTKRRLLRGVIARDLTKEQAEAIDPYTFKKDGGWFIREKHLVGGQLPDSSVPMGKPENVAPKSGKPELLPATENDGQSYRLTTQRLHRIIQGAIGKKSSKYSPSQRIDRQTYDVHTKAKGVYGVMSGEHIHEIAKVLDEAGISYDGSTIDRGFLTIPIKQVSAPAKVNNTDTEKAPSATPSASINYDGAFDSDAIPEFGVKSGISEGERRQLNAQALDIVRNKAPEDITDDDRQVLAKYSGTGGIGDSLNEFYTDTRVAAAMWKSLYDMGLPSSAEVLEPSCGTGVFMHTAPAGVKVVGVEMDGNSSRVASLLHGVRHEVQNASLERFATQDTRQFDAVIGNPPFGLRGSLIKDDKPDLTNAESYFIDTALDKCKPGGLVALVVPTGVMDSKSGRAFRERMLRKGQFLGAMRMPNTAFKHAHTGVTTDVIYLRKRPDDVAGALMTVDKDTMRKLGVWDDDFLAGRYFTDGDGKSQILGTMTEGWRAKAGMGQDITVEGSMVGVPEAIAGFSPSESPQGNPTVPDILEALGDDDKAKQRAMGGANKRPYAAGRAGDTKVVDGVTYVLQGNPLRWHKVEDLMQADAVADAAPIAAEIERLMTGGAVDRQALETAIREYIDKHGNPAKSKELQAAAGQNKALYRLIGAVKPDGSLSDAVTGRLAEKLEGGFDVVAHTLATRNGQFSSDQLAEQLGKDVDEVVDHLYASGLYAYLPESGNWTTMDAYLSGELWAKYDAVKAAMEGDVEAGLLAKYQKQAAALDEAIDPRSLEDVDIAVNNAWIPLDIVSEFFTQENAEGNAWQRDLPAVQITFDGGLYHIKGGNEYSLKLVEKYLNRTGVKKDDMPAIEAMNAKFKDWLCASQYRDHVEELYNRKFRGFRAKSYSSEPFQIPGLQAEGLKQYQYAGLRWALETGRGIIAADVGLGKTARGLILARMAKISGQAQKPVIVVPKSVLANWVAEANKWFPGSKVLTIGGEFTVDENGEVSGKDDSAADRKRKYHDLTQNDYDFVLISQPSLNELDVSPAIKNNYLADDFWVQRGEKLGNAGDKRIRKIREQFEQSAAGREFDKRTDAIYFDQLGIDMLMVDEGHAYKNLYSARSRFGEQPKFLGGQGQSNRSFDMSFKARWIREQAANGGNVYMLTATPTKNSPLEIYSMLSYIAPEAFERIGIRNSEEFIDRFCQFENQHILGTKGDIEDALVTVGFKNMDELREVMRRYIDRTTAEDVGLKLPERDDQMHAVDMDKAQKQVYEGLRKEAEESSSKKDSTGDAHIFSIMDRMNKASIDLSLLGDKYEGHAGHESPKLLEAVKHIAAGKKDGGQVVFSDYVDTHEKLADMLVTAGIPRNEIGIINAKVAGSSAKRQKISDQFNAGKLSVVIGNTATMGEGINLQKGTTDIHHLDIPWEPASVQQRNGRGLRQGNINEAVRIHTYLSKGSFDGYRWMTVSAKRDWQDLLWNGGDKIENYAKQGDLSRDEMMVMLSADPEAARKKLDEDKTAAMERFTAERRRDAADQFSKLRAMQDSLGRMKSKGGPSAARLSQKIAKAKDALFANKHFQHKDLLDSDTAAVIHPDSGAAIVAGTLITPHAESSYKNKMVVTGVTRNGDIRVRHYGVPEASPFTMKLSDISSRDTIGKNDGKAEAAEIAAQMKAKITSDDGVKSATELAGVPEAAVVESYDAIQTRLKGLAKEYKDNHRHGDVLLINPEGKAVSAESYQYRDLVNKDHDFALPIAEHREKALAAWLDAERNKKFRMTWQQAGRGKSTEVFKTEYPGKYGQHSNPFESAGKNLFGEEFVAEAKQRLQDEVATAGRRAGSFKEAAVAMLPLAHVGAYGGRVEWPRRAIAVMYAKAKKEGALKNNAGDSLNANVSPHNWLKLLPGSGTQTVAETLADAAKSSGHTDLAATIYIDAHKDNPVEAFKKVAGMAKISDNYSGGFYRSKSDVTYPRRVLEAMRYLADKHPEIGGADVNDMSNDLRTGIGYENKVFGGKGHMTIREALKQALEGDHGTD